MAASIRDQSKPKGSSAPSPGLGHSSIAKSASSSAAFEDLVASPRLLRQKSAVEREVTIAVDLLLPARTGCYSTRSCMR